MVRMKGGQTIFFNTHTTFEESEEEEKKSQRSDIKST